MCVLGSHHIKYSISIVSLIPPELIATSLLRVGALDRRCQASVWPQLVAVLPSGSFRVGRNESSVHVCGAASNKIMHERIFFHKQNNFYYLLIIATPCFHIHIRLFFVNRIAIFQ